MDSDYTFMLNLIDTPANQVQIWIPNTRLKICLIPGLELVSSTNLYFIIYSWENMYDQEVQNFRDHGDEGEIWFGKGAERRVVDYVAKRFPNDIVVADLGCGNGHLCLDLHSRGFKTIIGIDYSQNAITLSYDLAKSRNIESCRFDVVDLLDPLTIPEGFIQTVDVALDKGTFDAICLGSGPEHLPLNFISKTDFFSLQFKSSLFSILKPMGLLIITSCNWTKDELIKIFTPEFEIIDEINHQSFKFGGSAGQAITTIVFQLKSTL